MAATPPTSRSPTWWTARPWSPSYMKGSRSTRSTVGQPGCSYRTCTSGRAPSGCASCASWSATSPDSGSRWATIYTATPGASSATPAIRDHTRTGRRRRGARQVAQRAGDVFELRGPIGGYFVWGVQDGGPLFLVAGGSGIVPLMSMLRHRSAMHSTIPTRLLYSSRRWDEVIYRDELLRLADKDPGLVVTHTITRDAPAEFRGYRRRIDRAMLEEAGWPSGDAPLTYICGPT